MKAIIVAGGIGERLRPITNSIPKPVVKVAGKPILEHVINLFKEHSITEFIISVCYLPERITDYFGSGDKFGVKIKYIYEDVDNPLGTAGNIASAKKYIKSDLIVTYADILRDLNISDMIKFHLQKKAFSTLNIYKRFGKNPKSMVLFNKEKQIEKFFERPSTEDINDDFVWCNGSFYIFKPEIFDYLPTGLKKDFGKDIFPLLIKQRKAVYAFPTDGYFIDIGDRVKLEKARKTFKII